MEIVIRPTPADVAVTAADIVAEHVRRGPTVLGLATGSTPLATYQELIRRHRDEGLSFADCVSFNLDEYVGLPKGHPESYREVIRKEFTSHVDIPDAKVEGPDGTAADIAAALITIIRRHTPGQLAERAGIYHYCGSPYASWFEFAETIFAEAAAQGVLAKIPAVKPLATADYPTPAKRPADSRLDCGKIRAVFGIGPCDWHSTLSDLQPYL